MLAFTLVHMALSTAVLNSCIVIHVHCLIFFTHGLLSCLTKSVEMTITKICSKNLSNRFLNTKFVLGNTKIPKFYWQKYASFSNRVQINVMFIPFHASDPTSKHLRSILLQIDVNYMMDAIIWNIRSLRIFINLTHLVSI